MSGPFTSICAEPRPTWPDRRKELGAYYTPLHLAQAITDWAIRSPGDRVLDPAAGEAVFLEAAASRLRSLGAEPQAGQLIGVEIDPEAFEKAQACLSERLPTVRLELADFFESSPKTLEGPFSAVVGNPPYVRYHRFRGAARQRGIAAAAAVGVQLNGLSSSWAPFVVHAAQFLAPGGRLGLVLPAELLQVDYAAPVREFLLQRFAAVTVITFERAVFPGALVDTVILLAEDGVQPQGLRVICLDDALHLTASIEGVFSTRRLHRWSTLRAPGGGVETLQALEQARRLIRVNSIASVDIGCVTGANSFFILAPTEVRRLGVEDGDLQPIIGRPAQLRGAIVRSSDRRGFGDKEKWLLLRPRDAAVTEVPSGVAGYLEYGRTLGIDQRYKCRVRRPWYVVPSVRVPDAFLSYMSHRTPRIALNSAGVTSTNLVHQLAFAIPARRWKRAYVAALYSSISLLSFELEGRSYGGGVLKLETREAERVLLPRLDAGLAETLSSALENIDEAVRGGCPEKATELVDTLLLTEGVIDIKSLEAIRGTLDRLQKRRASRGPVGTRCSNCTGSEISS